MVGNGVEREFLGSLPGNGDNDRFVRVERHIGRGMFVGLIRRVGHQFQLWRLELDFSGGLGDGFLDRLGYGFGNRLSNHVDARCSRDRNGLARRGHGDRFGDGRRGRLCLGFRGLWLRNLDRPAAQLDPDILSASRGDDGKAIRDACGRRDVVLDRPEFGQRHLLIGRQDLTEHARHRIERQHARRQST